MKMISILRYAICLTLLLQTNPACADPYKSWAQLTPLQHEALQPLAVKWDSLPAKLQKNLLVASSHYPELTPEQKILFQSRLDAWSQLTPEQREQARENYRAFSKIKPKIRAHLRQMAHKQTSISAASGVSASKAAQ